jgi:hypothetical protein
MSECKLVKLGFHIFVLLMQSILSIQDVNMIDRNHPGSGMGGLKGTAQIFPGLALWSHMMIRLRSASLLVCI